jgi:hypothetical protein
MWLGWLTRLISNLIVLQAIFTFHNTLVRTFLDFLKRNAQVTTALAQTQKLTARLVLPLGKKK